MVMSLNCYCVLLIPCGRIMRVLRGDETDQLPPINLKDSYVN